MVSGVMAGLVLFDGLGEEEAAPVCDSADDAALGEYYGASCACNSVEDGNQLKGSRIRRKGCSYCTL